MPGLDETEDHEEPTEENTAPELTPSGVEPKVVVVGHGGKPMSEMAIAEKAARERRKVLREEYGTDDPAKIAEIKKQRLADAETRKAEQEELTRLRKTDEERQREQMSETERLRADAAKEKARADKLENELKDTKRLVLVSKQDAHLAMQITAHKFKAKFAKHVLRDLGDYFQTLPKREQDRFGDKELKRWLTAYAKENPEYVEAAETVAEPAAPATPTAKPAPVPVRRVPVGVRVPVAPAAKPASTVKEPGTNANGKTFLPNRPNSMTPAEVAAEMKKRGMKPYGSTRSGGSRYAKGDGASATAKR